MDATTAKSIQDAVLNWALTEDAIRSVALIGSWARMEAGPDSDIDLIILCRDPSQFRRQTAWLAEIGWAGRGFEPIGARDEDYGDVWSKRVTLAPDIEVEIGFALTDWARIDPVDPGTRQVVAGGCQPLLDRDGDMRALLEALRVR